MITAGAAQTKWRANGWCSNLALRDFASLRLCVNCFWLLLTPSRTGAENNRKAMTRKINEQAQRPSHHRPCSLCHPDHSNGARKMRACLRIRRADATHRRESRD
jgi:hypothetical protein